MNMTTAIAPASVVFLIILKHGKQQMLDAAYCFMGNHWDTS
jgi:hypothetical protein